MAKTLVIVGAGPGFGMGIARAFGRNGFQIGLIARSTDKLATYVAELGELGIKAAGFPADICDHAALIKALDEAKQVFGAIDVLEYSPIGPSTHAAQAAIDAVFAQFDPQISGAAAAVNHVLPDMLARKDGALLLTTGVAPTVPAPFLANAELAMVGLRNWAHRLHVELKPHGIYAGAVMIPTASQLGGQGDPDGVGAYYYQLYQRRDQVEYIVGQIADFKAFVADYLRKSSANGIAKELLTV